MKINIRFFQAPDAVEGEELEVVSNTGGWTTNDAFVDESLFEETSGHKNDAMVRQT